MRALVTGGTKGLGAAIARTLRSEGYSVVVHGSTGDVQGDFSSREGVEAFLHDYLSRYGETEVLINNVGPFLVESGLKTHPDDWYNLFQTNLHAPFLLSQALAPTLKSIVNIGIAGLGRADTYSTAYTAAKAALLSLTKSLAKEMRCQVNMVSPGYLENSVVLPPGQKPVSLNEVSQLVAFLLKHPSITGQNIEVAAGVRL